MQSRLLTDPDTQEVSTTALSLFHIKDLAHSERTNGMSNGKGKHWGESMTAEAAASPSLARKKSTNSKLQNLQTLTNEQLNQRVIDGQIHSAETLLIVSTLALLERLSAEALDTLLADHVQVAEYLIQHPEKANENDLTKTLVDKYPWLRVQVFSNPTLTNNLSTGLLYRYAIEALNYAKAIKGNTVAAGKLNIGHWQQIFSKYPELLIDDPKTHHTISSISPIK